MQRILPIKGIKRRDAVRPLSCEKRVLKYCLRKVAKRGFRWSGARRRTGREGMKQSCGRAEDGNGNERERTKMENGMGNVAYVRSVKLHVETDMRVKRRMT